MYLGKNEQFCLRILAPIAVDVEDEVGEETDTSNALNKARDYNSDSISECESSCDRTTGIQYKT